MNNQIKRGAVYCLIVIIALLTLISCNSNKTTITGFAVLDENATNETITTETTTTDLTANQTTPATNETIEETKEKPEKEAKPEEKPAKPEPNKPPVWKSDVDEFVVAGKTTIDLNNYFFDENNDTITYASTAPEKISVEIQNNLAILTPIANNFTTSIEFTASDGDKTTSKEVILTVPERSITINLQYKPGTNYDSDDNGVEATTGVVDLTVENSQFTWEVNETNLCTRWEVFSVDSGGSTTVCYGSEKCCAFVGLGPTKGNWKENFYAVYGQYGATLNNIVSSRIIYVDYGVRQEKPYSEIYYSSWQNLSTNYYFATIDFKNVCVDTCSLSGFNLSSYNLIFEIENAVLNLDLLTYSIEEITKVLFALTIVDNEGTISGNYTLYKDNIPVTEESVEPDYYKIEVFPQTDVIDKLVIENVEIADPLTADIGIDNVGREILIDDVDVKKRYAVNLEELEFEKATLTATASANSLFKCRQWDYESEVCFGTWEKIKDLVPGEQYDLTLTPNDPGFIEGNSNITLNITPINITAITLIKEIPNITININNNATINLSNYFLNADENTIFTYYEQDNIIILFENGIATILPDKNFVGVRYSFITATKGSSIVVSNLFSINVVNVSAIANITPN
ncbi:MAG: hypothetical protein HYS80_02595, partial [Candidatus Aenigmarchaeota archaeon]|nr:hypothetical protein [Candidatus Aenigmarchaeota archaeon]